MVEGKRKRCYLLRDEGGRDLEAFGGLTTGKETLDAGLWLEEPVLRFAFRFDDDNELKT